MKFKYYLCLLPFTSLVHIYVLKGADDEAVATNPKEESTQEDQAAEKNLKKDKTVDEKEENESRNANQFFPLALLIAGVTYIVMVPKNPQGNVQYINVIPNQKNTSSSENIIESSIESPLSSRESTPIPIKNIKISRAEEILNIEESPPLRTNSPQTSFGNNFLNEGEKSTFSIRELPPIQIPRPFIKIYQEKQDNEKIPGYPNLPQKAIIFNPLEAYNPLAATNIESTDPSAPPYVNVPRISLLEKESIKGDEDEKKEDENHEKKKVQICKPAKKYLKEFLNFKLTAEEQKKKEEEAEAKAEKKVKKKAKKEKKAEEKAEAKRKKAEAEADAKKEVDADAEKEVQVFAQV